MIAGKHESNIVRKNMLCECKCKFDRKKQNLDQWLNNNKCQCEYKKHHICDKDYI